MTEANKPDLPDVILVSQKLGTDDMFVLREVNMDVQGWGCGPYVPKSKLDAALQEIKRLQVCVRDAYRLPGEWQEYHAKLIEECNDG